MPDLRVNAYVDGFNLYYGLKSQGWGQYYWIDPYRLIEQWIRGRHVLHRVRYFTARVRKPAEKRERQAVYLGALQATSAAEIIFGKFYKKRQRCAQCRQAWDTHEEKMTDTAIGVNLVADAFTADFDIALLVGGDTDIVPAIKMVRRHRPGLRLVAWFPPARKNQEVADVCDDEGQITGEHLKAAVMPDQIVTQSGHVIQRPSTWVQTARPPGTRIRIGDPR